MSAASTPLERIRKLVRDDPRAAVLILEILGPPPGIRQPLSDS